MKRRAGRTISDTDLREILEVEKETRSGQYVCRCPFCGKESHMYVDKKTQLFDCKRCGTSGNIYKLLRYLNKTYLLGGSTVVNEDTIDSIRGLLSEDGMSEKGPAELPEVRMPAGWRVLSKSDPYLMGRGMTPDLCERYRFGKTDMFRKYDNYILIPVYDGGKIRGFVGRYADKNVPDGRLRYNNSTGTQFASLLYGYDEITEKTETVVLVEGIFDKIAVDRVLDLWSGESIKCVCTFGKKVSEEQRRKLRAKGVSRVILLYDFDAVREMKKFGMELDEDFVTDITFTTKKDIDECTEEEALAVFGRLYRPKDFNVDVIGKLRRK